MLRLFVPEICFIRFFKRSYGVKHQLPHSNGSLDSVFLFCFSLTLMPSPPHIPTPWIYFPSKLPTFLQAQLSKETRWRQYTVNFSQKDIDNLMTKWQSGKWAVIEFNAPAQLWFVLKQNTLKVIKSVSHHGVFWKGWPWTDNIWNDEWHGNQKIIVSEECSSEFMEKLTWWDFKVDKIDFYVSLRCILF